MARFTVSAVFPGISATTGGPRGARQVYRGVMSSGRVKEFAERGPQAVAGIALGMRERFVTKAVVGKVLSGVGVVSPLFYSSIGSALPMRSTALPKVEGTSALQEVREDISGEFKRETFGAVRRSTSPISAQGGVSEDTAAVLERREPVRVQPFVQHRSISPTISSSGEKKFAELRANLQSGPMARGTPAHGFFWPSFMERVELAERVGKSNVEATSGIFAGSKPEGLSVLGARDKTTPADPLLPEGVPEVTLISDMGPLHSSLSPKVKVGDPKEVEFSAWERDKFVAKWDSGLKRVSRDTAASSGKPPANLPIHEAAAVSVEMSKDRTGVSFASEYKLEKMFESKALSQNKGSYVRRKHRPLEEYLQRHRFIVFDATGDGRSVFEWEDGQAVKSLVAGFSSCDAPFVEVVTESVKEGTWEFPRQIPVSVTEGRLIFRKGVIRTETDFWVWIQQALRGNLTRRTIRVLSYGRDRFQTWGRPEKSRRIWGEWTLVNCFPVRYQAGDGWDAYSGDVLLAELEVVYEFFEESTPEDVKNVLGLQNSLEAR